MGDHTVLPSHRWQRRRRLGAICLCLVALGCPKRTAVWVEKGSTIERLAFRISDKRDGHRLVAIGVLRVNLCALPDTGRDASWIVSPADGTPPVERLVYGETPPGFRSEVGPDSLTPGCYRVSISGSGRTTFQVDSGGAVREDHDP